MSEVNDPPHAGCNRDVLAALLRGELSAVETYDQAMSHFEDQHVLTDLLKIREDHARAAEFLRERVVRFGGSPPEAPGLWSTFAALVGGAAGAVNPAPALSALRQGEEHEANGYEDALTHEGVDPECKSAIRAELLPQVRQHVEQLNRLLGC